MEVSRRAPLPDLFEFGSGLSKPRSEFGSGFHFLSFKDVFENFFVPDELTERVNSTAQEQESCSIRRGDVFLTRTSETMDELGMSCVALRDYERATFNGFTKRLRPKRDEVVPEYAGYFFRSPGFRQQVTAMATLSTRASLNNEMLSRLTMDLPPVRVQEAIGQTLKSLDDKIELNRRMNETLEGIARAIFKSWFVDFDPVRAKMEGRQPHDISAGNSVHFEDALETSPIGLVPAGWTVSSIGEHFEAVKGVSYKGSGLSESGMPMHNLNSILEGGGYKYDGIKFYTGEYKGRHVVGPGDVIVANTEQGFESLLIGFAAQVPEIFGSTGLASHHLFIMRPRPDTYLTGSFLVQLMNSGRMHDLVSGYANGTTVNMLSRDGVQKPQFPLPPQPVVKLFESVARPIARKIQASISESQMLASLRDTLLPKLISGEIRLKDAEAEVEAAV